ncbi:ABC transporter permease [Fusibacter sp. 3D3]|uniref:ABC transporter permease n=1 Tax=Fusibacter sp. 3D3 TaxID=1048380 RepID=UPI000852F19A|nr:ABC transporter permease [Fusibacter sp. 3D3]GAU77106.1 bacitracin transport permease protein BCRB [Fusibacter sp. 3D3]
MLKLMKLESQKYNIKRYIFKSIVITLILLSILLLIFFADQKESEVVFKDINQTYMITKTLVNIVFLILASVMLGRIVIGEYDKQTISLLFSYPISRKKLMLSKILLIGIFIAFAIILSTTFLMSTLYIVSHIYYEMPFNLTPQIYLPLMLNMIINSIAYTCLSSICLYFGLKKNSSTKTIIVGVIIALLLGSNIGDFTLGNIILVPICFAVVGLLFTKTLIKNIEQNDI